jgi:hypothetical protein
LLLRDRRNTRKTGIPAAETKSAPMGDDPLAIYKRTGARRVDNAKAITNFAGWTYAALNAGRVRASEPPVRAFEQTERT